MEILLYYHCKLWLKMPIFLTLIRNPFKPKGKITWPVWTVKKLIFKFMQNGKQFQVPPHIKKRRSLEDLYFPISKILNGIEMVLCRHKDRHQTSSESRKKKTSFAQVIFDRCANTLNGESMSLRQTVQEQLLTHMCEARLPQHIYKNLISCLKPIAPNIQL